MYYEEKMIRGQLCWRASPNARWRVYTKHQITERYLDAIERCDKLKKKIDDTEAECSNLREEVKANAWL